MPCKVDGIHETNTSTSARMVWPEVHQKGKQVSSQTDLLVSHPVMKWYSTIAIYCSKCIEATSPERTLTHVKITSSKASIIPRLELCWRKGIFYVIEQPSSSLLFHYKPLRDPWKHLFKRVLYSFVVRFHNLCVPTKNLLWRHRAHMSECNLGDFNAATLKPVSCQGIVLNRSRFAKAKLYTSV
jgi:hypothetical protein